MAIDNSDDVLDSRDVIKRITELEDERECCISDDHTEEENAADCAAFDEDDDLGGELARLRKLQEQAEGYTDWRHGAQLIRDTYFETYARELAEDTGLIDGDAKWPYTCIDWERAARELQSDYTSVEYGDVTYWVAS